MFHKNLLQVRPIMDIEHFYIEQGEGYPLILLHGNGENGEYFRGQIGAFSKQYHVYAPDTRGHGKTPRGNAPFTIRRLRKTCWVLWMSIILKRPIFSDFRTGEILQ